MPTRTFRSLGFAPNTRWSYELMCAEAMFNDERYSILVYDRGFEPPYYDVNNPFDSIERSKMIGGLGDAHAMLAKREIFVAAWMEVYRPLTLESNAVIRPDIRMDLRESTFKDKVIPPVIEGKKAQLFIKEMAEYAGHSATVSVKFVNGTVPFSFTNNFYLMFRNPPKHPVIGFVGKGAQDDISLRIDCEGTLTCALYDQKTRSFFEAGEVFMIQVDLVTAPIGFRATCDGHKSYAVSNPQVFTF